MRQNPNGRDSGRGAAMTLREFLKLWVRGQAERASEIIYYEPFSTPERTSYWKKRFHQEREEYAKCRDERDELRRENDHLHKVIQSRGKTDVGKLVVQILRLSEHDALIVNKTSSIKYVVPLEQVVHLLDDQGRAFHFVESLTDLRIEIGKKAEGWE